MNKKELLKGGLDDIYRKYYFDLKERIEKAIEYIEELISDTKGIISAYNYADKEETVKIYIEELETDIKHYEYLSNILRVEEENKKIEKLNANEVDFLSFDDCKFRYSTAELEIVSKINEIIDRLNGEDNE